MATILIVDDQVLNREFLTTLLGYSGHRLLASSNGAEALEVAAAEHPDLVITDILMPNMDGYEFVSRMRGAAALADTPIIFYTATYREREANLMARACGVQRVLAKPSDPETILRAVQETLGLPHQQLDAPDPAARAEGTDEPLNLDEQVADYLSELNASSHLVLKLAESCNSVSEQREDIGQVAQRLSRSLSDLQMVSLRLTALIELGLDFSSETKPERAIETGCRVAQDLAVAKYAMIGILDERGEQLQHFSTRGMDDATATALVASLTPATGVLAAVLATRLPHRASGMDGSPHHLGLPASHPPVHSFLAVPIATSKRAYGWLYLVDKLGADAFNEIDEQATATVGAQLAIAYENLVQYDEVQRSRALLQVENTERMHAQEVLRRTLRNRTVMAKCSQVMVHAADEQELLQKMCETVVEAGGYLLVWIAYAQEDGTVQPMAHAGTEREFLRDYRHSPENRVNGSSPAATAIRDNVTCLVADIASAYQIGAWRERAVWLGYRSAIALPLKESGHAFGALVLHEGAANAFGQDDVAMLEELAEDIAYGVRHLRDRVARNKAERELLATEQKLSEILGSIDNIVWSSSAGRLLYVNPVVEKIYGRSIAEFQQNDGLWLDVIHPEDQPAARKKRAELSVLGAIKQEYRIIRPDGRVCWIEHRSKVVRDSAGNATRIDAVESDITDRKEYEARIEYLADHDALTGLANRNLLNDRITQAMAHARRNGTRLALLFLDLDRFKSVNDSVGHAMGDMLLKAVSVCLLGAVRDVDTVARQGGDEFIILLTDLVGVPDVIGAIKKIINLFSKPFVLENNVLYVTTSIGATIFPDDGDNLQILSRNADTAMYQAKSRNGNTYHFYSQDMSARALERSRLEGALRQALEHREFEVYYQPKPDLYSGRIVGAEALIRWRHPERGMISPAQFIPLAEEIGLIVQIGRWVLETACAQNKAWQDMGLPAICMAINLSARQFVQEEFVDIIAGTLEKTGLDAACLELELTESMVMDSAEHFIAKLHALKKLGVLLSIDDFGTGYSSLSYLKRFALDRLKIDQSFIRDIVTDPDDAAITRSVIALGHSLNMKVIAEGVETAQQLHFLQQHHCDEMQGFYFSPAVPAADFAALLRQGTGLYN